MKVDTTLYLQLHKLSAADAGKSLPSVLSTLWRTRRTGVSSTEKSCIRSLLNTPPASELDPVLACLRSLIRKCVHEDYGEEDLLKLFPPDLPLELQTSLVHQLLRNKDQWREELSKEQGEANTSTNLSHSEASASTRPYRDDPSFSMNGSSFGFAAPVVTVDSRMSLPGAVTAEHDNVTSEPPACRPRLKSMSWTMENSKSSTSKVALITLKLGDHSKSPTEEMEVKFQLTKDTFEAMLLSMTNIKQQIYSKVGAASEPLQKKQKL